MILVGIFYIVSLQIPQSVDFVLVQLSVTHCIHCLEGTLLVVFFLKKTLTCCFIPHIYICSLPTKCI
jgi:hypothetical protein